MGRGHLLSTPPYEVETALKRLGANLRMARLRRNITLADVAARIDEILSTGLHAFLTQFLDRVNELGGRISKDFLVPAG